MLGMGYVQSVFTAIASGLQETDLREGAALRNVTVDDSDEGPLLIPWLMNVSPVLLALFATASVKLSQSIYSKGIVDADGNVLPQASFYQQYLDVLRRETAFNLCLCLWVAVTEFYREEEEEVPQFLVFFLMTVVLELVLNFSASLYDHCVEKETPLRSNFLTKLKHIVLRSTVPSVITAPLIKEVSFDILYRRKSTSHPWLWVTLAGASTQIPRQMVTVFLPRIANAVLAYRYSKTDGEVSHSETDDEEQPFLFSDFTHIKGIDDSLIISLPWSLLATITTTLSWDMASWLCSLLYRKIQYDKFDNKSLLLLEMTAGATVGLVIINAATGAVILPRRLCQSQKEIATEPVRNLTEIAPPASPLNLSDRKKRVTVRETQRQLHARLGITLITAAHDFDYHKAKEILYEATKLGDGLAWCYLGFLYEYGLVVPPSLHAASFFYKEANGNHAFIKLVKSVCYLRRLIIGSVSCYENALILLIEAVDLNLHCEFKDWQDTLEFLDSMAQVAGNVSANLILALVYELGLLGVAVDLKKASHYYERISTQGESWTQYNLGMVYQQRYKQCPEGDEAKAYYAAKAYCWLNLSVQPEHKVKEPLYSYNLGVLYREGFGVMQNYKEAMHCFEQAHKLGCTAACSALATMHAEGLGCDKDFEKAKKYEEESDIQSNNRRSVTANPLSTEEALPSLNLQHGSKEIDFNFISDYRKLMHVKTLCDFCDSERLDRLPFKKGEILQVCVENKNWLYAVNAQGLKGMVPRNAIATIRSKSKSRVPSKSYQDLSIGFIDEEEISDKTELDNRTYTCVSLGFWGRRSRQIVIKELKEHAPLEEIEDFRAEGLLMAKLDHPNIVKLLAFIGVYTPHSAAEKVSPKLVMEYMFLGELSKHFPKEEQPLSEILPLLNEQRLEVALHIAEALCYLHGKWILHLDVKSMNVLLMLLQQQLCAKLVDFGTARQCGPELRMVDSKRIGTEDWLSPELRYSANSYYEYTRGVDVYAYGVLLWEIFTYQDASLVRNYLCNEPQSSALKIPPDIDQLIRSCCAVHPKGRPVMSDIVSKLKGSRNSLLFFQNSSTAQPTASVSLPSTASPQMSCRRGSDSS